MGDGERNRIGAGKIAGGLALAALALVLTGCLASGGGTVTRKKTKSALTTPDVPVEEFVGTSTKSVTITWQASHVKGVNSAGGGYRVYYTKESELGASAPFKKVAYSAGTAAPTSLKLTGLASGSYTLGIVAYTLLNPTGSAPATVSVEIL